MRSLNGEDAWKKFLNGVSSEERHRYHRINVGLPEGEPRLDDVDQIATLKELALQAIPVNETLTAVTDYMIASAFYFELDDIPARVGRHYQCCGYISCRLDLPLEGRSRLYEWFLVTSSWFVIQGRPAQCTKNIPKGLPPFRRRLSFLVDSLEETVSISICGITTTGKAISGFPTTIGKLITAQQLDCPFGTVSQTLNKRLPLIPLKRAREDDID